MFLGLNGSRDAAKKGRKGFAIYVTRNGKKRVVRQFDSQEKKLTKTPRPKKLSDIDVSRVRSKRAKKVFLESHTNEVSRGVTTEKARFGFKRDFKRIDQESEFAKFAAKGMLKILRGDRSGERNYTLQIGVTARTPNGLEFFETQIQTLPGDLRKADIDDIKESRLRAFFGHQVYAFIARELANRGYVLAGSANFVRSLPENKGRRRDKWTKQGFAWQGADKTDVKITGVEWRFLKNTFERI